MFKTGTFYFSEEAWAKEIVQARPLLFNEKPEIISPLCKLYGFKPVYILQLDKGKPVVSFIAFTKGKHIKLPIHFFYSALWVGPNLSDTKRCQILLSFLDQLKRDFKSIQIKLPHQISEIRPFIWKGFEVENRFTYVKDLHHLHYAKDVNKNIAKWEADLVFKEEALSKDLKEINLEIFRGRIPTYRLKIIDEFLDALSKTVYLKCFSCYFKGQLLASHILLLDYENKIGYTVLRNQLKGKSEIPVHAVLYHRLFTHLAENGYKQIDLLGADLEKISLFKSRFKADLFSVNILRYSRTRHFFAELKPLAKKTLLKLFSVFKS